MKIVIELDDKLRENEILIYKNGKVCGKTIAELLPDYKALKDDLSDANNKIVELTKEIKHLKGED